VGRGSRRPNSAKIAQKQTNITKTARTPFFFFVSFVPFC
jgi:hypothetical protein